MDALLDERWRGSQSPFAGDCLVADDTLTVDELRDLLKVVSALLRAQDDGAILFQVDDWHQHDGFVTQRRPADWSEIEIACTSRESLVASRQGDTWVYRAFYPERLNFLLRFDIGDEEVGDGTGLYGAFDLCADSHTLNAIVSRIAPDLRAKLTIIAAKPYFDRTYSG